MVAGRSCPMVVLSLLSTSLSTISMAYFLMFLNDLRFVHGLNTVNFKSDGHVLYRSSVLLNNLLLIGLFAVQHSLFARTRLRSAIERCLPWSEDRFYPSFYALGSSLAILALCHFWIPMNATVWSVGEWSWLARPIITVDMFFWAMTLISVLSIHRFQLCGGEPLVEFLFGRVQSLHKMVQEDKKLVTTGVYGIVRHPAMFFLILSIWTVPLMSAGQFLLSAGLTIYIVFAVKVFEEPQLVEEYKQDYIKYKCDVPYQLIPGIL